MKQLNLFEDVPEKVKIIGGYHIYLGSKLIWCVACIDKAHADWQIFVDSADCEREAVNGDRSRFLAGDGHTCQRCKKAL